MKNIFLAIILLCSSLQPVLHAEDETPSSPLGPVDKRGLYVLGGLTTSWFVGNERLSLPFAPTLPVNDTAALAAFVPGSYYKGQFPGLGIRGMWIFDEERNLRANFGLDYHFYSSRTRELSGGLIVYKSNTHYIPAITGGFEYAFLTLPLAQAKVYAGIDVRGTFVVANTYKEEYEYVIDPRQNSTVTLSKEGAFRLGGGGRLGIEGEIFDPWYVNLSVGWSFMNAVGRDDARGELLTPYFDPKYENKETRVYNIFANLFVQYRIQ